MLGAQGRTGQDRKQTRSTQTVNWNDQGRRFVECAVVARRLFRAVAGEAAAERRGLAERGLDVSELRSRWGGRSGRSGPGVLDREAETDEAPPEIHPATVGDARARSSRLRTRPTPLSGSGPPAGARRARGGGPVPGDRGRGGARPPRHPSLSTASFDELRARILAPRAGGVASAPPRPPGAGGLGKLGLRGKLRHLVAREPRRRCEYGGGERAGVVTALGQTSTGTPRLGGDAAHGRRHLPVALLLDEATRQRIRAVRVEPGRDRDQAGAEGASYRGHDVIDEGTKPLRVRARRDREVDRESPPLRPRPRSRRRRCPGRAATGGCLRRGPGWTP